VCTGARRAVERSERGAACRAAPRPIFIMPRRAAYDKKWGRGMNPAPRRAGGG